MKNEYTDYKGALKIARSYPKGPHSRSGIYKAGDMAGFSWASDDRVHIQFHIPGLRRYCEISNKPTLLSIAKKLGTSVGSVKYAFLTCDAEFQSEMGRRFVEPEDADKIIKRYKERHNGKATKGN